MALAKPVLRQLHRSHGKKHIVVACLLGLGAGMVTRAYFTKPEVNRSMYKVEQQKWDRVAEVVYSKPKWEDDFVKAVKIAWSTPEHKTKGIAKFETHYDDRIEGYFDEWDIPSNHKYKGKKTLELK